MERKDAFQEHTSDKKPLSTVNFASVAKHVIDDKKATFNQLQVDKFDRAVAKLRDIKEAQTLCVHRF